MRRSVATAAQIQRAIRAAQRAGLAVDRVEVDGTKIVVFSHSQASEAKVSHLDRWLEKRRGAQKSQSGQKAAG